MRIKVNYIKDRMKELGMTTGDLAELTQLNEATIRVTLRGAVPRRSTLMLMAQGLKCELSDLTDNDERTQPA